MRDDVRKSESIALAVQSRVRSGETPGWHQDRGQLGAAWGRWEQGSGEHLKYDPVSDSTPAITSGHIGDSRISLLRHLFKPMYTVAGEKIIIRETCVNLQSKTMSAPKDTVEKVHMPWHSRSCLDAVVTLVPSVTVAEFVAVLSKERAKGSPLVAEDVAREPVGQSLLDVVADELRGRDFEDGVELLETVDQACQRIARRSAWGART